MIFGTRTLLATLAIMSAVATTAHAKPMNYVGDWSNTVKYSVGQVVQFNGALYYSLKSTRAAPNLNLIPSNNPTWWAPVGTIGNTILSGVGNPTSPSLGQVGDFYINTQTNTIFGPKTAIAPYWPASGISLVGSSGETGSQGPVGATGPQGATGAKGPAGPAGAQGPTGARGAQGPAGPKGDTGERGPTGPIPPPAQTLNVDCDNNGSVQATIDSIVAGTAATINVSGTCAENVTIVRGKTISLVGQNGASLMPTNDSAATLVVRGDLTVQGLTIKNSTGPAEELVSVETGSITIIGSELIGPNASTVLGVYLNSYGTIWNTNISAGTGIALEVWGGGSVRIGARSDFAAGPDGFVTNVSTTSGWTAALCAPGGSIYTRLRANGNGSMSFSGGQNGLVSNGCSLSLTNDTDSSTNLRFSGSDNAISLNNSQVNLSNGSLSNSSWGLNANLSTIEILRSVFSNNGVGDIGIGYGSTLHIAGWNGRSSFPDYLNNQSFNCWNGSNIYIDADGLLEDIGTTYDFLSCLTVN